LLPSLSPRSLVQLLAGDRDGRLIPRAVAGEQWRSDRYMQLQPRIVETDAELLAATASMAIVMKTKNPRMQRLLRESGSASPGLYSDVVGTRD
jgi:hypothetical protein